MKRIILAVLMTSFAFSAAIAQSCESKAVSADGKPLHGAAKTSFVKKCKKDACEAKASAMKASRFTAQQKGASWQNAGGLLKRAVSWCEAMEPPYGGLFLLNCQQTG
jgi:hypothetical protein